MGADGGSICNIRDIIVSVRKNPEKLDRMTAKNLGWTLCAVSKEPIKEPIVCDIAGTLMRKDAVIEMLLEKNQPPAFRHIQRLKDVIECKMTLNPDFRVDEAEKLGLEYTTPRYICPATMTEMRGLQRFHVLRSCGHVLSSKFVFELKQCDRKCPVCGTPFTEEDLLELNLEEEARNEVLDQFWETRRAKKLSKSKHHQAETCDEASSSATCVKTEYEEDSETLKDQPELKKRKYKSKRDDGKSSISSSVAQHVVAEAEKRVQNLYDSDAMRSVFTNDEREERIRLENGAKASTFILRAGMRCRSGV